MKPDKCLITPRTKISQLLEAYPQLEDVLIEYVPAFQKLKNPVLRKTVAKVATLQQAAGVGRVNVGDLVNRLRQEVGQELFSGEAAEGYNFVKPQWYDRTKVKYELDARPMLAKGEHPVNQVMADLNQLPKGVIYKLIVPFVPAPLIDKASSLQLSHWVVQEPERVIVYFTKDT